MRDAVPVRQARSLLLAAVLAALLIGCGESKFCTLVGFESAVRVRVPDGAELVEFCLGGACVEDPSIALRTDNPETYAYRVVLALEDGEEQLFDGEVTTKEHFANGEGCDPKTANATLELNADGSVTIRHP